MSFSGGQKTGVAALGGSGVLTVINLFSNAKDGIDLIDMVRPMLTLDRVNLILLMAGLALIAWPWIRDHRWVAGWLPDRNSTPTSTGAESKQATVLEQPEEDQPKLANAVRVNKLDDRVSEHALELKHLKRRISDIAMVASDVLILTQATGLLATAPQIPIVIETDVDLSHVRKISENGDSYLRHMIDIVNHWPKQNEQHSIQNALHGADNLAKIYILNELRRKMQDNKRLTYYERYTMLAYQIAASNNFISGIAEGSNERLTTMNELLKQIIIPPG